MKIELKKKDVILAAMILCVAFAAILLNHFLSDAGSGKVIVKVDGEITGTYALNEDRVVEINGGTNTLEIRHGEAKMTEADCPDQLCVYHRAISENGKSIICLPNRVFVEIQSNANSEIDAVTN